MTNPFNSSDVINLALSHLRVEEIPRVTCVSLTWAETARPLIIALLHERVASLSCSQRLIVEAGLGAVVNFSLLANGQGLLATTSGRSGDGKLRAFGAATFACGPSGVTKLATGGSVPLLSSASVALSPPAALGAVLALPDDQEVIGAVQLPGAGGRSSGAVVGLAVGEGLGFGAALHSWDGDSSVAAARAREAAGGSGGEFGHLGSVLLEHSSTLSGPEPMLPEGEPCLFKCRAAHAVSIGGTAAAPAFRCLVHNASLASAQRAQVAAWDSSTGGFLPGASAELNWEAAVAEGKKDAENRAPLAASALDNGRYGGVDCAFAVPPGVNAPPSASVVLATGHARGADGVCRVRIWELPSSVSCSGAAEALPGAPLGAATLVAELIGPTLPTKSFSVAGVQALSLGSGWVAAACADGRVHLWRLSSGGVGLSSPVVAVLGSQGVLAACKATASLMARGLAKDELPPEANPRSAAAEACTALGVDPSGKFLLCAFSVALKRSSASFASGRKKEVRLALFRLSCGDASSAGRHPLRSPVKAKDAGPVASFCGLLPEVGIFQVPQTPAQADAAEATEAADAAEASGALIPAPTPFVAPEYDGGAAPPPPAPPQYGDDVPITPAPHAAHGGVDATPPLAVPRPPKVVVSPLSVCGGEVRVTKVAMDLERRGKVTLSCACTGSHTIDKGGVKEVDGFVAEYNFLAILA